MNWKMASPMRMAMYHGMYLIIASPAAPPFPASPSVTFLMTTPCMGSRTAFRTVTTRTAANQPRWHSSSGMLSRNSRQEDTGSSGCSGRRLSGGAVSTTEADIGS